MFMRKVFNLLDQPAPFAFLIRLPRDLPCVRYLPTLAFVLIQKGVTHPAIRLLLKCNPHRLQIHLFLQQVFVILRAVEWFRMEQRKTFLHLSLVDGVQSFHRTRLQVVYQQVRAKVVWHINLIGDRR